MNKSKCDPQLRLQEIAQMIYISLWSAFHQEGHDQNYHHHRTKTSARLANGNAGHSECKSGLSRMHSNYTTKYHQENTMQQEHQIKYTHDCGWQIS